MFCRIEAADSEEFWSLDGKPPAANSARSETEAPGTQIDESGSVDNQPLPVVILGTRESTQSVHRALTEATICRGVTARPIQVIAIYRDGVLAICDQTGEAEDLKRDQGVARRARTFLENSLAIANEMRPEPGSNELHNRMRWVQTFAEYCGIEHAVMAAPTEYDAESEQLLCETAKTLKHVLVIPKDEHDEIFVHSYCSKKNSLTLYVGEGIGVEKPGNVKELLDIVSAIILGVLGFPFLLLVSLLICIDSPGPILYRQLRIGKGNRVFTALKFRTMCADATQRLHDCLNRDSTLREEWNQFHKLKSDPRITRVGRVLRRFSIDELPQLWNILACDMSLVGPRPIVAAEVSKYGRNYKAYERAKPGLTGLWQVSGRNDTSYRRRVYLDAWYVRHWSLRLDVLIILRTFGAVLSGLGTY